MTALDPHDVRVMVPRVRRAIEGAGQPETLTDDAIKDIVADALADLILYTGGVFGKELEVTERDDNGIPTEYQTSDVLTLPEQSAVAAQAALDFFFFRFAGMKTSETIQDEAQTWTVEYSPQLLTAQLKMLQDTRDKALQAISDAGIGLDSYTSYLAVRDVTTSRLVEGYYHFGGALPAYEIDYRFGTVG